jgi:hypothetical protein
VTHGLQSPQGEVEAWVQMMEVGPWTSQKCASEIWKAWVSRGVNGGGAGWGHMTGRKRRASAAQGLFGEETGTSARVLTVKSIFSAI